MREHGAAAGQGGKATWYSAQGRVEGDGVGDSGEGEGDAVEEGVEVEVCDGEGKAALIVGCGWEAGEEGIWLGFVVGGAALLAPETGERRGGDDVDGRTGLVAAISALEAAGLGGALSEPKGASAEAVATAVDDVTCGVCEKATLGERNRGAVEAPNEAVGAPGLLLGALDSAEALEPAEGKTVPQ